MNKKEELKTIIDSLNKLMGKIDSVDEPKQQPKYPEGILRFNNEVHGIVGRVDDYDYQEWCDYYLRHSTNKSTIHSVKNSNGIVFTVDDFDKDYGKILGFTLGVEDVYATFDNPHCTSCPVFLLAKVEKPQPSWKDQIVAFRNKKEDIKYVRSDNGWFDCHTFPPYVSRHIDYLISRDDVFEIFTVKNKAGVEFSVGDEVYNEGTNERFTIKGFQKAIGFREDLMVYERKDCIYSIEFLTKAEPKKEPTPLFKTEDGFDVYDGDCPYYIRLADMFMGQSFLWHEGDVKAADHLFFKEKSNAEKYVAENKKSISYKDLEDFLDTNYVGAGFLYEDIDSRRRFRAEIINHFKPK